MSKRAICVSDLSAYNAGRRHEKWIELPKNNEELKEEIQDILEEGEEWHIVDWENMKGIDIDRYSDPFRINEQIIELEELANIKNVNDEVIDLLLVNSNIEDAIDILESENFLVIWQPSWANFKDKKGDLAHVMWEDFGYFSEITKDVEKYIDWEKVERNLLLEGKFIISKGLAIEIFN